MRAAILAVVVLGLAVTGSAQSAGQTTIKSFSAKSQEVVNGTTFLLRGDIRIQIGDVAISADEADVDGTTREVTLRGNVRLQMPPGPTLASRPTR